MIRTTVEQKLVIESPNGKIFEAEYNKAMKELAKYSPKTIYPENVPGHCAYIVYTESIVEAEDARDRLELKGVKLVCGQCPYYKEPGDGRKKIGKCEKGLEAAPYYTKCACNFLCEMVELEIIEPVF